MKDPHCHCPCNLTYLCGTCHRWAHAHPFEAKQVGLIVSRFVEKPGTIPAMNPAGDEFYYGCDGKRV